MTWWLGNFLSIADPTADAASERWAASAECNGHGCARSGHGSYLLHNGTMSSPLGFMFAVDRAAALQRSRRFLQAQYRICKVGVRVLPPGNTLGAPNAARLSPPAFLALFDDEHTPSIAKSLLYRLAQGRPLHSVGVERS